MLSHTYNPSVISRVALNGVACGESGVNALVALGHGVPVALITGDQVTVAEAEPFCKQVEQVTVKESITRFAAAQVHPEVAREMIYAGAEAAVRRLGSVQSPDIELPARLDIELQTADLAQVAAWVKGVERSGTRSVRIVGEDPLEVYRSFVGLTYITQVAEDR